MLRRTSQIFFFAAALSVAACGGDSETQVVGFSFDADDNLFNLPTEIKLFHVETGEEVGVTTAEFALIRGSVGVAGSEWEKFEIRGDDRKTGSFRFFGDEIGDGVNYFLTDLRRAMVETPEEWQAPAFDAFTEAMAVPASVPFTTIITARGHEPETIREALLALVADGLIEDAPASDDIWTVSNPMFGTRFERIFGNPAPGGDAASPSARKAAVMQEILDDISERPIPGGAPSVIRPDANGEDDTGDYHLWGFSDDDFGNFEKAVTVIQAGLDEGRWPNIKVTLYFTGLHDPDTSPHAVVLVPNAEPRPVFDAEEREWKEVLDLSR